MIKPTKRAKLFVWLREHRHELFDEDFQVELAGMYQDKPVGQPPVPPAQLGLATILQAYTGASDDEVLEACVMDRRWQLVLDCMDHATAPFSKTTLVAFRKRHVLTDLDTELVSAVGVTAANVAEAEVAKQITADLDAQQVTLGELHIDRADLSSSLIRDRDPDLQVFCKAFPVRNGPRLAKPAFALDFDQGLLTCPNSVTMPFVPGGRVQFPATACQACPLRAHCTSSSRGRSVQLHPDERLLVELRAAQQTPHGRARLRQRTQVEHTLAHVGRWQGDRAR